jgi:hypothetical protein
MTRIAGPPPNSACSASHSCSATHLQLQAGFVVWGSCRFEKLRKRGGPIALFVQEHVHLKSAPGVIQSQSRSPRNSKKLCDWNPPGADFMGKVTGDREVPGPRGGPVRTAVGTFGALTFDPVGRFYFSRLFWNHLDTLFKSLYGMYGAGGPETGPPV